MVTYVDPAAVRANGYADAGGYGYPVYPQSGEGQQPNVIYLNAGAGAAAAYQGGGGGGGPVFYPSMQNGGGGGFGDGYAASALQMLEEKKRRSAPAPVIQVRHDLRWAGCM